MSLFSLVNLEVSLLSGQASISLKKKKNSKSLGFIQARITLVKDSKGYEAKLAIKTQNMTESISILLEGYTTSEGLIAIGASREGYSINRVISLLPNDDITISIGRFIGYHGGSYDLKTQLKITDTQDGEIILDEVIVDYVN